MFDSLACLNKEGKICWLEVIKKVRETKSNTKGDVQAVHLGPCTQLAQFVIVLHGTQLWLPESEKNDTCRKVNKVVGLAKCAFWAIDTSWTKWVADSTRFVSLHYFEWYHRRNSDKCWHYTMSREVRSNRQHSFLHIIRIHLRLELIKAYEVRNRLHRTENKMYNLARYCKYCNSEWLSNLHMICFLEWIKNYLSRNAKLWELDK